MYKLIKIGLPVMIPVLTACTQIRDSEQKRLQKANQMQTNQRMTVTVRDAIDDANQKFTRLEIGQASY